MPVVPRKRADELALPLDAPNLGQPFHSGDEPATTGFAPASKPTKAKRPATPEEKKPAAPDASGQARPSDEADGLWVEALTDWSKLAALEEEWQALASSAVEPNAFYEPWMLLPALRAFGKGERLEVALVFGPHPSRAKGKRQLCGLFPLHYRRGRAELWHHPCCYLTTPLLREGSARGALSCLLDWLAERASMVRLEEAPGDGEVHLMLVDELGRRGWPSVLAESYTRAILRCDEEAEAFLERALPGKRRKELRRQRARLAETGALEVRELASGADPKPWLDELMRLEASGWKGREKTDIAAREGHAQFLSEMATAAAARGRLQHLGLYLDGRAIALKLNVRAGPGSFALKIAFDEKHARFSPGVQLELENVRAAHALEGLRWMDSCAAPNRFMINHLWPDRREMQTFFFATGGRLAALQLALLPLLNFIRSQARRRRFA